MKHLTIVIPAYNAENYIYETLQSVLNQVDEQHEVIVVDDGSTDNTAAILKELGNKIRYVYQKNQGESVARNKGIELATGELIVFLDSDDLLEKSMISTVIEAYKQDASYKVFYGNRASFNEDANCAKVITARPNSTGNIFKDIVTGITLVPGQFAMHRSCLERVGLFDEKMQLGEDWKFLLLLSKHFEFKYFNKVFLKKRIHPNMQTLSDNRPDIVEQRKSILSNIFNVNELKEIESKYLTNRVYADWYRTYGFPYIAKGNKAQAIRYIQKSLKLWPFQPKLWIWLINHKFFKK